MRKLFTTGLLIAGVTLLPAAASVEALTITPSTGTLGLNAWQGTGNSTPEAQAAASAACGCIISAATESYKAEGTESGPLAGSYNTVFTPAVDPSGATITYTGGLMAAATTYLLVKDGNQNPSWYLFNLTALGWNYTETLELSGFWPAQGAISHIALYGPTTIPEPTTLSMLGLGLAGLVAARRRRNNLAS